MKTFLLAFVSIFATAISFAQQAPSEIITEVTLPLAGIVGVNFYEATAAGNVLVKNIPVASALTTGILTVKCPVAIPVDGLLHTYFARTVKASTPLPAVNFVSGGESKDSNTATALLSLNGVDAGPKNTKILTITFPALK